MTDIEVEICKWKEEGDKVSLLMDFNDDICNPTMLQFFRALDLYAVHLEAHGVQAPPMHQCSQRPIDSIFAPLQWVEVHCGYLAFCNGFPKQALWNLGGLPSGSHLWDITRWYCLSPSTTSTM